MSIQMTELHFSSPPKVDPEAIRSRSQAILGEMIEMSGEADTGGALLLIHTEHPVEYKEGKAPAQTAIIKANAAIDLTKYQDEIDQSWGFRDCAEILSRSRHTLLVTELMARLLPPIDRVWLYHGVLQAVIEHTRPNALVCKHSQQVVNPQAYLDAIADDPIMRPGALNVRFYRIENSGEEMLMDTRGLTEVGLHDLQCHFRQLDPNDVSRVLYNTAIYIFENGPVIEAGNTVAGTTPDSMWRCQFENSIVEPKREVLDLNPGESFAAGNREG